MRITKEYVALIDNYFKGRLWFSNGRRKLTDAEARPLLDAEKITEYDSTPKRMVHLTEVDGQITILSWGEYLKRRRRSK